VFEDRVDQDDDRRGDQRQFQRALRLGESHLLPEMAEAPAQRFIGQRRERQQDHDAQIEEDKPPSEAGADSRKADSTPPSRCRYRCCCCRVRLHQPEVETPSSPSILATEPVSSSKNSSLTLPQPPNLLILKRSFGVGNCFASTRLGLTGR